jgi:hypothetical protein
VNRESFIFKAKIEIAEEDQDQAHESNGPTT